MDLSTITDATDAIKETFGAIKVVISTMRDATELLPEGDRKTSAQQAIREAEKVAEINEAQIAQALGYQLCHCEFPPKIMLKVGAMSRGSDTGQPVYECPACNQNTAQPRAFNRYVSRRDAE